MTSWHEVTTDSGEICWRRFEHYTVLLVTGRGIGRYAWIAISENGHKVRAFGGNEGYRSLNMACKCADAWYRQWKERLDAEKKKKENEGAERGERLEDERAYRRYVEGGGKERLEARAAMLTAAKREASK